jgi:hypothetical protein
MLKLLLAGFVFQGNGVNVQTIFFYYNKGKSTSSKKSRCSEK